MVLRWLGVWPCDGFGSRASAAEAGYPVAAKAQCAPAPLAHTHVPCGPRGAVRRCVFPS